jgi:hypothetical protein
MQVVIYMCIEATIGISLYSYLYLQLAKILFLIIAYVFSSTKSEKRAKQVLPGSERGGRKEEGAGCGGGDVAQTMYAHMN